MTSERLFEHFSPQRCVGAIAIAATNSTVSSLVMQKLTFNEFAPGASFTHVQLFRPTGFDASDKPVKLIITFDAASENQRANMPHNSVVPPNYRISLGCSK